jgi:hypothetical protein
MTETTRGHATKEAQDHASEVPPNLDNMPSGIISIIAEHLRADITQCDDSKPHLPKTCQCTDKQPACSLPGKEEPNWHQSDAALSLSCVTRSLRSIAFTNRINRALSLSYCDEEVLSAQAMSEVLRNNVR